MTVGGGPVGSALADRPATMGMTEDGAWAILNPHWSAWGGAVARATGVSSASTGVPNMAQAPRITHPAQITLSSPGSVLGHEVYRCFQLTVPAQPRSDQHECLARHGSLYLYEPVSSPTSAATSRQTEFFWPTGVACSMGAGPTASAEVWCESRADVVTLLPSGQVSICRGGETNPKCLSGNAGEGTPTLAYGHTLTVGPFRCTSSAAGVTCVVTASGRGFTMSASSARKVGP